MAHQKGGAGQGAALRWLSPIPRLGAGAKVEECSCSARVSGRFPPDLSALLGLGFEQVSSSRDRATVRKIEGSDLSGRIHTFTEVEIRRNSVVLRYSQPSDRSSDSRRLQVSLLLLRVLSLVPRLEVGASGICRLLLPALEFASDSAGADYQLLHKKFVELSQEDSCLRERNRKLMRTCEDETALSLERERQISALSARVASLEAVSDAALRDLVLEWLSTHHGAFSAVPFSQQARIRVSRAEEGLEMLLKSGAIRKVGGKFLSLQPQSSQIFEPNRSGLAGAAASAFSWLRKAGKRG